MNTRRRLPVVLAIVLVLAERSEAGQGVASLPHGTMRLGNSRPQHPVRVVALAFTPDGSVVASADENGRIRLWDVATGQLRREFPEQTGMAFAISPDGKRLATAGMAWRAGDVDQLQMWSLADGKSIPGVQKDRRGPLAFAPDGESLVCTKGLEVVLIAADTGKEIRRLKGLGRAAKAVAVSRDGKWVGAGTTNPTNVVVWDAATGKQRCKITDDKLGMFAGIAFSRDGNTIAVATPYHISLWDATNGKFIADFGTRATSSVALDKDGKSLVTGGDITVFDPEKRTVIRQITNDGPAVLVAISPDGKNVVSVGDNDSRVRLWDADTGKEVTAGTGHRDDIRGVAYSPDGKLIATGSGGDGTIRLWNAATGAEIRVLKLPGERDHWSRDFGLWGFAFSADGKVLTASGQRWEVTTGRELAPVPDQDEDHPKSFLAYSPDGRIAVASERRREGLLLIDTVSGRTLHEIRTHEKVPQHRIKSGTIVFSPDGKFLVVAAAVDRFERPKPGQPELQPPDTIHLFDVKTGQKVRSLRPGSDAPQNFTLSPDGAILVVPADHWNPTKFWDVATGKLIRELSEELSEEGRHWRDIAPVAFAPDGRLLALVGPKNTVTLVETATGKPIRTLAGQTTRISALAFSPDGLHLVSGGADLSAIVWPIFAPGKETVRPEKWDSTTGEKLWKALAAEPAEAYSAVNSLLAAPKLATAMLKERLKPDPEFDAKELARWIAALGSPTEAERDAAVSSIRGFGSAVEPLLYKAARSDDPEFNRRVRRVLRAMASPDPDPEELRGLRAISTLERIATVEAETVLESLARGRDDGTRTRAAQAALLRLEARRKPRAPVVVPLTPRIQGADPKTLYSHKKQPLALAFTPDGKIALSASQDGKVRRWDMVAGKELAALPEHPGGAFAVAVSGDGKRIVTAGADGKVRLLDANGREEREYKGNTGPIYAAAFSANGRLVAVGGADGTAKVWDAATGALQQTITVFTRKGAEIEANTGGVTGIAFTQDGKGLVTTAILPGGNSINDRFFPTYTADKVHVWSIEDGSRVRTIGAKGSAVAATGGRFVVTGVTSRGMVLNDNNEGPISLFAGDVAVVGAKTGRVLRSLDGGTGALSPDGRLIAIGMGSPIHLGGVIPEARNRFAEWERLRLWEVATGAELMVFGGKPPVVVAFSPDGRQVLYGTSDGDVKLADTLPPKVTPPVDRMGLEAAWSALVSEDAVIAYQAIVALAASKESPQFLKAKLHPAPADDAAIVNLIAELDGPRYVLRRAAVLELERRGAEAIPALSAALTRPAPVRVKKQIEALLAAPSAKTFPEPLRRDRAIWALERMGTTEAKAVIAGIPSSE